MPTRKIVQYHTSTHMITSLSVCASSRNITRNNSTLVYARPPNITSRRHTQIHCHPLNLQQYRAPDQWMTPPHDGKGRWWGPTPPKLNRPIVFLTGIVNQGEHMSLYALHIHGKEIHDRIWKSGVVASVIASAHVVWKACCLGWRGIAVAATTRSCNLLPLHMRPSRKKRIRIRAIGWTDGLLDSYGPYSGPMATALFLFLLIIIYFFFSPIRKIRIDINLMISNSR